MATIKARIGGLRSGTAALWSGANPVLLAGEPAFETDSKRFRIGDGVTAYNALPYITLGGAGFQPLAALLTSLSGLGTAANKGFYTTGINTVAEFVLTPLARALLDDADQATMRSTLGLQALAILSTVGFAQIDPSIVVTSTEKISANQNNTTFPTSKAVYDVSGRVLLASKDASASPTLDFTEFDHSLYRYYEFELEDFKPTSDAVTLVVRLSPDGILYDVNPSDYMHAGAGASTNSPAAFALSALGAIRLTFPLSVGNAAAEAGVTGTVKVFHAGNVAKKTKIMADLLSDDENGGLARWASGGQQVPAQVTMGMRFFYSAGNIASGTIRMYGILQ